MAWKSRLVVLFALIILFCAGSRSAVSNEQPQRIYFLESLTPTLPAAVLTLEAFGGRLREQSSGPFEIFIDYLELGRFPGQAHEERTARYLAQKYAQAPPALLITLGRGAAQFLGRYRDLLGPDIPAIIASVPIQSPEATNLPRNSVGVVTEINSSKTLALARRLQPTADHVAIVAGASAELDRASLDEAKRELAPFLGRYNTSYIVGLPYDDMLQQVSRLSRQTIAIVLHVFTDGSGRARVPAEVAADVAQISSAPVYASVSTFFGRGIVGGYMDSFEDHGIAAANLAVEILAGKALDTLPRLTKTAHVYRVDARQLEKWGLAQSRLPTDAIVSFKQRTVWEQYRWQIMAIASALLLQTGLIIGLIYEHRRRLAAEIEARRRMSELAHVNRVATAGAVSASIAHELNQPLAAIAANGSAGLRWLALVTPDLDEARASLRSVVEGGHRASQLIGSIRSMYQKDDPERSALDVNEIIREVMVLLRAQLNRHEISIQTDLFPALPQVSGHRVQLQQVTLNLIMNAAEAMDAVTDRPRVLRVKTEPNEPGSVMITVQDSGPGILPPENVARIFDSFFTTKSHGMGMGLSICRSIVEAHKGRLWASTGPDHGATFHMVLPTEPAHATADQVIE